MILTSNSPLLTKPLKTNQEAIELETDAMSELNSREGTGKATGSAKKKKQLKASLVRNTAIKTSKPYYDGTCLM